MKFSIGIFAYNEALLIADTIRDLFLQDLITSCTARGREIEVIIVPNGCTDDTASVARTTIKKCMQSLDDDRGVNWRVDALATQSKANAWNYYIHEASCPDADYLICLDADIGMPQRECLSGVVAHLERNPDAYVTVDEPVKDIVANESSGAITRLNRLITRHKKTTRKPSHNAIAGSLFCGRAQVLREISLPKGLVRVMDGFIKAMVITNCFTTEEEHHRLLCADECYHIFYAYNSLRSLFKHNRNLLVGIGVNAIIYDYLWRNAIPEKHAGNIIRELNEIEPDWVIRLIRENLTRSRRLGMLSSQILDPMKKAWSDPSRRSLLHLLVSALLSIMKVPVVVSADRHLSKARFEW